MDQGANSGPPFLLFYAVRAIRIPPPACAGAGIIRNGGIDERAAFALPFCAENGAKRRPGGPGWLRRHAFARLADPP